MSRLGLRAAAGLVVALLVASTVLWCVPHMEGENLELKPDAIEYAVVAHRLAAGEPPTLPIGDRTYPSRYPLGFPLLLVPAVVAGAPPHRLWLVSTLLALGGIAATYLAALRLTGVLAATWAALLLALAPLHVRYGVMLMSDAPSAALASLWALLMIAERAAGLGLAAGFAVSMRLMNLPLLATGAVAALLQGPPAALRFALGAALGLVPLAGAALVGWSGPLAGYAYWATGRLRTPGSAFGLDALHANLVEYGATLLGAQHRPRLYPWPVAVLAVVGVYAGHRAGSRRAVAIIGSATLLQCGLVFAYFFHDLRLLLTALPLVILLAACGVDYLRGRKPLLAMLLAATLLVLQARVALHGRRQPAGGSEIAALRDVAASLPPGGLIISDVAAPLAWLYWTRGTERRFLPAAVPPVGLKGALLDSHLRILDRKARSNDPAVAAPTTFLDGSRLSAAGHAALARRAPGVTAVLCTPFGQREVLPALRAAASVAPLATTSRCQLFTVAPRAPT